MTKLPERELREKISMGQHAAHWVHLVVTLLLFGVNVFLTQIFSKGGIGERLKYIGHEMVFLSIGIAASRVFNIHLAIVLITVLTYLLVWIVTLWLTQQVIDTGKVLLPQIGSTIILGCISVYASAAGILEDYLGPVLKSFGGAGL